jgi:6-phosphogluconolactonase (cycloisomerase 2 family)
MQKIVLIGLSTALLVLGIASTAGVAVAAAATPSFVYTNDNSSAGNSVLQYAVGPGGTLTLAGVFPTEGTGTGSALASQGAIAVTQNGHWLVTVDAGSNQITVFHIDPDGSLRFVSVAGSQGMTPVSVTAYGYLVYVLNAGTSTTAGNIAGFTLSNTGQLTRIAGSAEPLGGGAGSSPEQIGFTNDGSVLVVTEKAANLIDTYVVSKGGVAGAPSSTQSNSPGPYGFAFNDRGFLVLSEAATGTLSTYVVSDNGKLRTVSGSIPDFGLAPCWVAVSPDGRLAYTSNAHGGTISGYRVSGTGVLTLLSSVAAQASIPTLDLAFNGNGHVLYALNGGQITTFRAFPDGSLAQLSSVSVPTSSTGLATN